MKDLVVETVGSPNTGKTIELTTAYDNYKTPESVENLKVKYLATLAEACVHSTYNCSGYGANDPVTTMKASNALAANSSTAYDAAA